jgi:hypothetical protein
MYFRTVSRSGDSASASSSGPHLVTAYPPFDPHPQHAFHNRVVEMSRARYAKPVSAVEEELERFFISRTSGVDPQFALK